jgi:mRNA interferase HigB
VEIHGKVRLGVQPSSGDVPVMRVHLVTKETIDRYAADNARSKTSFVAWLSRTKYATWDQPSDIKETFSTADLLGNGTDRVVFDIGGNNYRMICKYVFGEKQVHLYVCWIGTHAEYDELCSNKRQYTIEQY